MSGPINVPDPDDGTLTDYIDEHVFGESINSLNIHITELQAVANPHRYALLYYVWDTVDGDLDQRIPRSTLVKLSPLKNETGGFQTHINDLLKADLLAQVPAPEHADGRQTFYRLTHGGSTLMDLFSERHPDKEE
jgi:hypothetical protein